MVVVSLNLYIKWQNCTFPRFHWLLKFRRRINTGLLVFKMLYANVCEKRFQIYLLSFFSVEEIVARLDDLESPTKGSGNQRIKGEVK